MCPAEKETGIETLLSRPKANLLDLATNIKTLTAYQRKSTVFQPRKIIIKKKKQDRSRPDNARVVERSIHQPPISTRSIMPTSLRST